MYEVVFSKTFKKELQKTIKSDPALWRRIGKTLYLLNTNINHRSLRLHKLTSSNYWSVSVSKSYRIKLKIEDKYIVCVKFGDHDEVY